jgi:hypothetical protein
MIGIPEHTNKFILQFNLYKIIIIDLVTWVHPMIMKRINLLQVDVLCHADIFPFPNFDIVYFKKITIYFIIFFRLLNMKPKLNHTRFHHML